MLVGAGIGAGIGLVVGIVMVLIQNQKKKKAAQNADVIDNDTNR